MRVYKLVALVHDCMYRNMRKDLFTALKSQRKSLSVGLIIKREVELMNVEMRWKGAPMLRSDYYQIYKS